MFVLRLRPSGFEAFACGSMVCREGAADGRRGFIDCTPAWPRDYGAPRLEAACAIANKQALVRLKPIKRILQTGHDRLPAQVEMTIDLPQDHDNVRGPDSFN